MINRIIQEEIQSFLVEGWKEEVIDMVKDEISHNREFASWWKSLSKYEKYKFLNSQFKLNLGLSNNVIMALGDSIVREFGEMSSRGKYRGAIPQYKAPSSGIKKKIPGYKCLSQSFKFKTDAVKLAKSFANNRGIDTYAVQSKKDGSWCVYGKDKPGKFNY